MMINVFLLGFILLAAAATSLPVHADRGLVVVTASSSIDEVTTRDVENAKNIAKSIGLGEANLRFMVGKELRKEAVKEAALKIASELKTDERFYFFLSAQGFRYRRGETCKVGVLLSNTDKPSADDVVTPEEIRNYLSPAISKSHASFLVFDAMEIGNFSQEIITQNHINVGRMDSADTAMCGGFRASQIETIPKVFSNLIASNKNHIIMLGGFGDEVLWDSPLIGGLFSRSLAVCLDPTLIEVRTESLVKCTQSSMNKLLASQTSREVLSSTVQFFGSKSLTTVLGLKSRENQDKGPVIASSPPYLAETIQQADPLKTERERLTAEVEAERKKRQELDAQRLAEIEVERKKRQDLEQKLAEAEAKERERRQAQTPLPQTQAAIRNERRVALLFGNGAYKQSPLTNSVNDAVDLNASLKNLGFQTLLVQNASLATMRQKTREFAELALNADVALIFFSGHGIEYRGNNYLIPTSAGSLKEFEVEDETFNVARWMDMLETQKGASKQRVNIVILDACRDNAFSRGWRNNNRGLARMDAPSGTILAYATAPGKLASDGSAGDRNSPYTKNLLRAIQQPNVPVEQVFKDVRRMVVEETKGEQVPWENSSLVGNFVFKR